jgi:hypothetical protein
MFEKGNNSFLIENLIENNKYEYDKNLIVNYAFNISNYAKVLDNEVFINLNLSKRLLKLKTEENRKVPVEFEYKDYYQYQTILKIPEGYSAQYIPKNIDMNNEYVSCSIHYSLKEDEIQYQHTFTLNTLSLDKKSQEIVNQLIEKVEQEFKEVVVLQKN